MRKLPNIVLGRYWIVPEGTNLFLSIIWVSPSVSAWVSWVPLWVPSWVPLHNFSLPHFTSDTSPYQIKSHEIVIFHKKNIIWYFCLFNPKTFLIFAQKVQYNTLLDMKIQEVMKLQRKALGITQQDLADMSEIAISTIKKIESGKGNPSLSTVEKIMDILGMEVKYEIRQTV